MLDLTLVKTASKRQDLVAFKLLLFISSFQELMKEKDKLAKERDDQLQEITQVRIVISKIFLLTHCMHFLVEKCS